MAVLMPNELIPRRPDATALVATQEGIGMAGLAKRGDTWHLRMRVPRRYASVEPRSELHRSLKTGDKREAQARLAAVEAQIIAELDARLAGMDVQGSRSHYEAIARLTTARGFGYRTAQELAEGDLGDVMKRVDALKAAGDTPTSDAAQALMGGIERPRRKLSELAEEMADLNKYEIDNKNKQQLHDWKQKWRRVSKRLVDTLGHDPIVDEITRQDIVTLRNQLQERVNEGRLDVGSANKDLQYLGRMIRDHHESFDRDDYKLPTEGVRCKAVIRRKKGRKPPVPIPYLEKWVVMSNWRGVNDELRDIMLISLETGCRESEIFNLPAEAFVLDHEIPHIVIQEEEQSTDSEGRQIKTTSSERRVPLVGVALEAALRHPKGFPRYRGNRNFSNSATKTMRAKGLIPSEPVAHKRNPDGTRKPVYVTAGGVRHSFEDRLGAVGVEMDTRGELMGHDVGRIRGRQHYGDKDLVQRLELHEKIAIRPVKQLPAPEQPDGPSR